MLVAPGRMRNIWYPRQMAEYMTRSRMQDQSGVVAERDVNFGMEQPESVMEEKEEMINVQTKLLAVCLECDF